MNLVNGAGPPGPQIVKKLEAIEDRGGPSGKDIKPVKTTLNRVPRSSEAALALVPFAHSQLVSFLGACVSLLEHALSLSISLTFVVDCTECL